MKFGTVPVEDALGAILAHSESVRGARLRKGEVLTEGLIAALQAGGVRDVMVARLEPGDLHEDQAADDLAHAIHDGAAHIHLTRPFTGRVNLIADRPGVVLIDADKINAANAIDPMITMATAAPFHQVHPGGMIATVKIIAYSVPETALQQAAARARAAIRLAVPVHATASLVVTDIPANISKVIPKKVDAIENRLAALDMTLIETRTCRLEENALAAEIAQAKGDIVLILTHSATSDIRDSAPEALRRAGGRIERFGMPVDPGNLLFLGKLGDKPVIGLPNSARSPVLHGVDWVLSRVACGIPVTSEDIAAMGVGGLLKEIPTRPMPRRDKER